MESLRNDSPPSSDVLNALEERVFAALAPGSAHVGEPERAALRNPATLYLDNPPIDPSESRQSTAELNTLLAVLDGQAKPTKPAGPTRAGYAFAKESRRTGEPGVAPAFVAALGLEQLRELFPDLWAIDAAVWEALEPADDLRNLARLWLESPGRRLVQDIGMLKAVPHAKMIGATNLSPERIDAAVGLHHVGQTDVPRWLRAHREQHATVPGKTMEVWEPKPEGANEQVVRALHLLEEGSGFGLRGAALAWLLDRAADEPFYEVDQQRRDLREDLTMRLATALRSWLDPSPKQVVLRQLETLTLHHAARFVAPDASAHAVRRAWAIARWLHGCLRRSPYFGGDEEVLVAHLRARLSEAPPVPTDADALHPLRFAVDGEGLDVAEVAFVGAVLTHYTRTHDRTLLPMPVPIVHALQRLAADDVQGAAEHAERALEHHNALEWPVAYSILAPVASQRLLTEMRIGWLAGVGEKAQRTALDRFALNPKRHEWLAFAVNREGLHVATVAVEKAVDVFRDLAQRGAAEAHVLATFGAGVLHGLNDTDADRLVAFAKQSDSTWRPFVLDTLAGAAFRTGKPLIFQQAMEGLFEVMGDVAQAEKIRLNAAFFAVQRVSPTKVPGREPLQKRIAKIVHERSFPEHAELRTAIRRFGLTIPSTGSKR